MKPRGRGESVGSRLRPVGARLLLVVGALLLTDFVLHRLDLLRPPFEWGDAALGFYAPKSFWTSAELGVGPPPGPPLTIVMVGDSHSALGLEPPLASHEFVLEASLRERGVPAAIVSAGQGKYSPLQQYLLLKLRLKPRFAPRVLLMNLYTGNDFYDMLRPDDRPHFGRAADGSIEVRRPLWLAYRDPEGGGWRERSRLLWALEHVLGRAGYPRALQRLGMLGATARRLGGGYGDVLRYLEDIKASIEPRMGYDAAFSAQILSQVLFFRRFPGGRAEALAFLRHLLETARRENADLLVVVSAIPSAALARAIPAEVAPLWADTLGRSGLAEATVEEMESGLYEELRRIAVATGCVFVDLLPVLRDAAPGEPLFNPRDLHLTAAASALIGRRQAEVLMGDPRFRRLHDSDGAGR